MKKPNHTLLIILLGGMTAFGAFSIDTYLPALPQVAQELNASIATIELSLSAFFIGMALGQLFVGPLSDRFGRKPPLYVGLTLYVVASLACALAPSAPFLIAARFIQALGGSSGVVIARAMVRDLFPPRETARVFSMLTLVMGVAPILAPTFGGLMLAFFSWRAIFAFLTLFGLTGLIAAITILPETRLPDESLSLRPGSVLRGYANLFRHPIFMAYSLVGGIAMGGMFAYISGGSFVYIEHFHLSPTVFAWIFGINAFGLIMAGQVNRVWLSRRSSESILLRVSPVQCAAGIGLLLVAAFQIGGLPLMLLFNFLFVTSVGFVFPNTTALSLAPFRREAGAAAALLGAMQFVIGALASSAVSAFHNGTLVPMTATMATCGVLSFLILQLVTRRTAPVAEVTSS